MKTILFKCLATILLLAVTMPISNAFSQDTAPGSSPEAAVTTEAANAIVTTEAAIAIEAAVAIIALDAAVALEAAKFNKNMNIWFMLMLVAFLMIFPRKFEWGICLSVILTAAASFVAYMGIQEFCYGKPWSQDTMIMAVTCAITVVLAIGVFIGTLPMWLYLVTGVLFTPAYVFLEYILWIAINDSFGAVTDPGGGILVHFFAAYWGIGVALAIKEKRAFDEPMYTTKHSVSLSWLAAMLLFILWPSFVTALSSLEDTTMVMANCYMSGFGSMFSAFIACKLMTGKVNPLVFMYAMLAGPVASSSSLGLVGPWQSLLLGLIAGALSAMAFTYLQPWLNKKLGIVDVMGVHQLHGVGGLISLLGGAYFVVTIDGGSAVPNIVAGVATLVLGIVAGFITGLIIKPMRGKMEVIFNDEADFTDYNPDPHFEKSA